MAIYNGFTETQSGYPNDFIDPTEKGERWHLQYARQMYADFVGMTGDSISANNMSLRGIDIAQNRLYMDGRQDQSQYMGYFVNPQTKDGTSVNLDFSIMSVAPKFLNMFVGMKMKDKRRPVATIIDPSATKERLKRKNYLRNKIVLKKKMQPINEMAGVQDDEMDNLPDTLEEFELRWNTEYKEQFTMNLENAIQYILNRNDWEEIRKQGYIDLFCAGEIWVRVFMDSDGRIRIRRCVPENMIFSFASDASMRYIKHAGEVIRMNLVELRHWMGDFPGSDKMFEEIRKTAAKNSQIDPGMVGVDYWYNRTTWDSTLYVDVLDAEWLSIDKMAMEVGSNKYGNVRAKVVNNKAQSSDRKKVQYAYMKCAYGCKWIVGTQFVFDYGKKTNQVYSDSLYNGAKLSYIGYKPNVFAGTNRPMANLIRPMLNQIQLLYLKMQAAIAKARPKGLRVEVSSLMEVMDGWDPLKVLEYADESGNVLWRFDPNNPNYNQSPIEELQNGLPADIMNYSQLISYNIDLIRQATGMNESVDGTMPKKESLVGVQKIAVSSANNALYPIDSALEFVFKQMCESIGVHINDLIRHKGFSFVVPAIGSDLETIVNIEPGVQYPDMGIEVELLPTEEQWMQLEEKLGIAMQEQLIDVADLIKIRRFSNIRQAELYLLARREQNRKDAEEAMRQNQMVQQQVQMESTQVATQMKVTEIQAKSEADIRLEQVKHQHKMEQLQLQAQLNALNKGIDVGVGQQQMQEESDQALMDQYLQQQMQMQGQQEMQQQQQSAAMQDQMREQFAQSQQNAMQPQQPQQ